MSRHKPKAGDRYWRNWFDGKPLNRGWRNQWLRVLSTANGRILVEFKCPGQPVRLSEWTRGEFLWAHNISLQGTYLSRFAPAPRRR